MKMLFILNDAPYGSEKTYNALRLAMSLQKDPSVQACVFLMGDAATCALSSQTTPQGYYNVERMLRSIVDKKGEVKVCKTCAEARGISELKFIEGIEIGTLSQLTEKTLLADKILSF